MDLIDREQAIAAIDNLNAVSFYEANEHSRDAYKEMRTAIKRLPSARPKGKWINSYDLQGNHYKRCSKCGTYIEAIFFANDYSVNFCPNCGSEMENDNEWFC